MHITRTIKVLTDLYGCLQFCCKLCKTVEIVVDDWLLNPCETEIIDRMNAVVLGGERSVGDIRSDLKASE